MRDECFCIFSVACMAFRGIDITCRVCLYEYMNERQAASLTFLHVLCSEPGIDVFMYSHEIQP